jgi:hypothetical protein
MGYKREYKTTIGKHLEPVFEADDPVVPEGDGWVFVNGTASGRSLYFFWYRDVKVEE